MSKRQQQFYFSSDWLSTFLAAALMVLLGLPVQADGVLTFDVTRGATGGTIGQLNTIGDDVCPIAAADGCDFDAGDDIVRTNDGVGYNFAIQVDPPGDNVYIDTTLKPGMVWDQLPGICSPLTSFIEGDGTAGSPSRLYCDLGFRNSFAGNLVFVARALGDNMNGATSGLASAEFGGDNCDPIVDDLAGVDDVTITASPHYNLRKRVLSAAPFNHLGVDGFRIGYEFHVDTWQTDTNGDATDDPDPLFGNEMAAGPVTFTEDTTGISPNAYIMSCSQPGSSRFPNAVFNPSAPRRSVLDAGSVSCDATGPGTSSATVTVSGADLSLSHYPTQTRTGAALPGDRRMASFGVIYVFIPLTDIVAAGGELETENTYGNISLMSISGQSNFEDAPQDANGGEFDEDNTVAFLVREGTGSFSHTYRCSLPERAGAVGCNPWWGPPTTGTLVASGDGTAEPTQEFASYTFYRNNTFTAVSDTSVCSVFDSRYYAPEAYNAVGDASRCHGSCGTLGVDYYFEYGVGYEATAWRDAAVTAAGDVGNECSSDPSNWYPTLAAAEAAGDVTKIRMVRVNDLPAGGTFAMSTRLVALPLADLAGVPNGTLMRSWGTATSSRFFPGDWRGCTYTSGGWTTPLHSTNSCGDRLGLTRALARIEKETIPSNLVNTIDAGGRVTFSLFPSFTSQTGINDNVTIVDTIPVGGIYVPGSATQDGAPLEPVVTGSIAAGQVLTWDLGVLASNEPIEPILFDMRTPLTTPNGTNLDNVARIDAISDSSSDEQRSATRRVTVTAPASMLVAKSVDEAEIPQDNTITYTVEYLNTTAFSFNEVDMIDILPFNGDGRFPPSAYSGDVGLVSVTSPSTSHQFYFTADAFSSLELSPGEATNDFATGGTNWCPATAAGTVDPGASPTNGGPSSACPATMDDVKAIRIIDTEELPTANIRSFSFTMSTAGNFGGDLYVNSAQGTSDGVTLFPQTPPVQTRVIEDAELGVAKANVGVSDGVVTFNIRVENLGNAPFSSVSLIDDLDAVFGVGTYNVESGPSFVTTDASAGLVLNTSFSGTGSQTNLLDPASTLAVGEFAVIELQVRVNEVTDQGAGFGVYENSATVAGRTPTGVGVTDVSDDGTDPDPDGDGDPRGADEDTPTPVVIPIEPGIEVVKTSSGALLSDPIVVGDEIEYTFVIENTGNVILTGVTLEDPLFTPSDITASCTWPGPSGELAAGETATCTERYAIDAGDIEAAEVVNTAVATGTSPDGPVSDDSDSGNTYDETGADDDPTTIRLPVPGVQITKAATENFSSPVIPGDTITYSLVVTNTGNVDLTGIAISDDLTNGDATVLAYDLPGLVWQSATDGSPAGTLTPGASATYVATYSLTAMDIDSGRVDNQATVTADNETGTPVSDVSDDPSDPTDVLDDGDPADPTVSLLSPEPGIEIIKSVAAALDSNNDGLFGGEDDEILYSFLVRNTGNVTLTDIMVTDDLVTVDGGPITLEAGQGDSVTFTATYIVVATDISRGYIENTATVTGTDPEGEEVEDISDTGTDRDGEDVTDPGATESPAGDGTTDDDTTNDPTVLSVPSNPLPQLELIKSIADVIDLNGSGTTDAGDEVIYTFTVRNTGNVDLADVVVNDPMITLSGNPIALIPVLGEDVGTVTGTYVIQPADVTAGAIENTATVDGAAVNSLGDPIRDPDTGEQLTATDVSDSGTDPELGPDGDPTAVGDPTATETPDMGGVTDGDPRNDTTVLFIPSPSITVIKTLAEAQDTNGDGLFGGQGDALIYAFEVRNTGNTVLTNVTIDDALVAVSGGPISLAPGGVDDTTFTATYTVTADDISTGYVENTATVTGDAVNAMGDPLYGPGGESLGATDISDTGSDSTASAVDDPEGTETPDGEGNTDSDPTNDPTVISVPLNPIAGIELVKSAVGSEDTNGDAVEGGFDDLMTYSFAVTNTGNYPLSNVEVNDPLLGGLVGTVPTLAVGETVTLTATYLLTYDDWLAGLVENQATATGMLITPAGDPIRDPETGEPVTADDISDTGTERDLSLVDDPETTESGDSTGQTNDDPTDDPTVTEIPTAPSGAGVSGIVYLDVDGDGEYTPGTDDLLAGYEVILYDDQGRIMGTAITDENGFYDISGFPVGDGYRLEFTDPATGELIGEIPGLNFGPDTVLTDQNALIVDERPAEIVMTKTTDRSDVILGETVPYTIQVTNNGSGPALGLTITDTMPAGLLYIPGTATVGGAEVEPAIAGRTQTFTGIDVIGGQTVEILLMASVSADAPVGEMTNVAEAIDPATGTSLATATATVRRLPEHVFDCSDIVGRVFNDRNFNGYQDDIDGLPRPVTDQTYDADKFDRPEQPGTVYEEGLANVRIATPSGTIITTDAYGRFSVPCAELPGATGSNFTLKVDTRTLPTGFRMTTENPRTMRVTAGIMTEMNFGAALGRVVDVDLTAAAFDGDQPVHRLEQGLARLLMQVQDSPSVVRITYFTNGEGTRTANRRLDEVEDMIRDLWDDIGSYRLIVERDVVAMQ